MALTKVVDIVNRVKTILQDTTSTRWPLIELQDWLNDAYKEVIIHRPDENAQTSTVKLAAGTRQRCHDAQSINLPNILRVMDVTRNMSTTSKRGVIRRTDRRILDDQRPLWHAEPQTRDIQHYMFDDRVPREFFVYPPAVAGTEVEMAFSSVPTPHMLTEAQLGAPTTAETIRISDTYANVIVDYMLYRAYSKDAEYAANGGRAQNHYNAFAASLGIKTTVDSAVSPNALIPPTPTATAGTTARG